MPMYEFVCERCKKLFDFLAMNVREKPDECPTCGHKKLQRKLSVFAAPRGSKGDDVGDFGAGSEGAGDEGGCGQCGGMPGSCASGMGDD